MLTFPVIVLVPRSRDRPRIDRIPGRIAATPLRPEHSVRPPADLRMRRPSRRCREPRRAMRRQPVRGRARGVPVQLPPLRRDQEMLPRSDEWDGPASSTGPRSPQAGQHGFLGMAVPTEYGGGGSDDFRFNLVRRRGAAPGGDERGRPRLRPPQRHRPPLPAALRHRGAVAAGGSPGWPGATGPRHRHDRAGHRLGPGVDRHDRPCGTATSSSSTARRRSSPTASTPTSWWWRSRPTRRWPTGA